MTAPSRTISIQARPLPITLDLGRTAVIVVDMQNDFGSPGGMFDRAGIDITAIQHAVAPTARVLAAARAAGVKIIYLKMAYRPDLADLGDPASKNRAVHRFIGVGDPASGPAGEPSRNLVQDMWGTAIVDALTPEDADIIVPKHRYSGFYGTDLDVLLRGLDIKYLVVTGCTTSVCVESTVRDAMFRDYCCLLLADCTAEPIGQELARSNHEASLLLIERMLGWVSESAELLEALDAPVPVTTT